jgi:DNA polymerase-3 subunit delta
MLREIEKLVRELSLRKIHRFYFLYGDDSNFLRSYSKMLLSALKDALDEDIEVNLFEGSESSFKDVINCSISGSFSGRDKLIVVYEFDTLLNTVGDDELQRAFVLMKNMGIRNTLILTMTDERIKSKLCKLPLPNVRTVDLKMKEADKTTFTIELAKNHLKKRGKLIDNNALQLFCEKISNRIDCIHSELYKLVSYCDDRETITIEDVKNIVTSYCQPPVYELTSSILKKDVKNSLLILNELIDRELYHPLQILSAISNEVQRMVLLKDYLESAKGKLDLMNVSYEIFKQNHWDDIKAKLPQIASQNPYSIYKKIKDSSGFENLDSTKALKECKEIEEKLKSTQLDSRILLERLIISLCH